MKRLNAFFRLCLVGACASGLLSGCASVEQRQFPTSYVAKPSPTNFIYEPQQSPNKSTSKVVIAIVRPRLDKEESKQPMRGRVQSNQASLAQKEATWRTHHRSLQEQYHRESQSGSIFAAAMTQSKLQQAEEVLKLIDLLKSGEKEVSDGVEAMPEAFLDSAQRDLERLLIAKGFKTSGPFKDHEEMTFSEKKDATFELPPTIKLVIDRGAPPTFEDKEKTWTGEVAVSAEFSLILIEPLSGQKIWAKRLAIPKRTAPFKVEEAGTTVTDDRAEVTASVLSALYKDLFDTISKQVDPEEFATLSAQSAELKERAAPRMK